MQRIVYRNPDNSVAVLTPTPEALSFATIEQIAVKDVPHGVEYVIINTDEFPPDRTFRDAWEWGFEEAHGVGGESHLFPEGVEPPSPVPPPSPEANIPLQEPPQ